MKIKVITIILCIFINRVYAEYPVIDITNVLTAIENGYTMYEQLNAMYNQIQNSYAQLQQQIKNYQNLEMGELDIRDPLGSWRSLMTYSDRLMTYEENIESILKTKTMKWGKNNFSIADVYSKPPLGEGGYLTDSWDDPFERELTTEEKAAFHSKYGISYGHYMRYNLIGEQITQKAGEVKGYFSYQEEMINQDRERLDTIVATDPEMASIVGQQQRSNAIQATMAHDIKSQNHNLLKIGEIIANQAYKDELDRTAMNEYKGVNGQKVGKNYERVMINDKEDENYK